MVCFFKSFDCNQGCNLASKTKTMAPTRNGVALFLLSYLAVSVNSWQLFGGSDESSNVDKEFTDWFTSKGGYLGGIELHHFENMGDDTYYFFQNHTNIFQFNTNK
jgi:hypothetical protein